MATAFETLRVKEKETRRKTIARMAEGILRQQGLDAVTIRNVAREAGLSTGAIYMYFKNKEEIFIYLLIENLKVLEKDFCASMASAGTREAFCAMAMDYKRYYLRLGKYIDLFSLIGEKDPAPDVDATLLEELRAQLYAIFAKVQEFMGGASMREALKGVSPERAVPVLWSIITGLAHVTLPSARARESGFDFDQVLADLIRIMIS